MIDERRPLKTDRRPPFAVGGHFFARLPIEGIVLIAFFLRCYRLADKNVWWDEGWSVWLSQKDLAWIAFRTAMDEHPPLHYWFLHFWNFIAGTDAFAGRFISVAFGVLTIALIYRIGKRVGGAGVGILAALFLAVARFHIWWSQDIKNYTPSIFLVFVAVWFALQILDHRINSTSNKSENRLKPIAADRRRIYPMAGYALFAALAMWTHYLAALVLLALNLYALYVFATTWRQEIDNRKSKIGNWIVANLLAAALFAPWLYLYLQNAAAWTAAPSFDFVLFLKLVATVLPLGVTTNIDNYAGVTIALTTLIVLGCIPQKAEGRRQKAEDTKYLVPTAHCLLPTLIVALPPLLVYALSLTPVSFFAPKIQARYLLILLPAYVILLALGIKFLSRLSRGFAVFAFLFLCAANIFVLNDYYAERRLTDEYTTLANTINAFARQGDVVLLNTDQEWPTFLYYLRYPLDWFGAPNGKAMTDADADVLVRRALNRSRAVWLVAIPDALATDPQKLLETQLARELPKRLEQTFGNKRLVLYTRDERDLLQVIDANLKIQHPLPVIPFHSPTAGQVYQAQLIGFDLPVREPRAGDTLYVTTYWFAAATRGELQLLDARGQIVQTTAFDISTGKAVRVVTPLNIPPDARGEYALRVRVRNDVYTFARISVEPRCAQAFAGDIAHRVDYRLGDSIRLIGYDLPGSNLKPNETLNLKLFWRAERAIEKNYTVFVHVVGTQFNPKQNNPLWGQVDRPPKIPTTAWLPGEIVREEYAIRIDADAPPGKYTIVVGMYDAATGARLPVDHGDSLDLAEIEIR